MQHVFYAEVAAGRVVETNDAFALHPERSDRAQLVALHRLTIGP